MADESAPNDIPAAGRDRRAVPIDDVRRAEGKDLRAIPIEEVRRATGDQKVAVQRAKVSGTKAFRRTRADRVLGAAGIALVLVGAWMVFNWVPPVDVPPSIGVDWVESTMFRDNETFTIVRDQPSLVVPIDLQETNLTRIAVTISWVDEVGDEDIEWDTLILNLTGPEASGVRLHSQSKGDNVVGITVPMTARLSPKPDVRTVPARDLAEAEQLLGDQSNRTATGEWQLEIVLSIVGDNFTSTNARIATNGQCPQQGIPNVCEYDPGQTVTVGVEYSAYHHEFRES